MMSVRLRHTSYRERKPRVDREHAEAVALMQIVSLYERKYPDLARLTHIPNGGARGKAAAGKLKAEGVRRGVPDYLLPVRAGDFAGLAIELKAGGGRLDPEQRDWLNHLQSNGWMAVVAYGANEAWSVISKYLGIRT